MDNTLEPAEHASVVREYRAYESKQKKRQAHAIQSQNNKDRSKYYSYVKICKTYNEQNKLIEEAYFDVDGDPPRSNRVIASWSDEMYVIGVGRNSGTQSTMHYFHKYHAVGRFRRNISGFFFFSSLWTVSLESAAAHSFSSLFKASVSSASSSSSSIRLSHRQRRVPCTAADAFV